MKKKEEIIASAKNTILLEAESLKEISKKIGDSFYEAVNTIYESKGRVVVTGIGKSAIVAQKIVATLNSTGTASIFMHAADAIHGDLGIIQHDDVIICISKSGNTPEIKVLVPFINSSSNNLIAICGNAESYLVKNSTIFLDSTVEREACPNNLAPTTSTTAQMTMGDALAVALLEMREFTAKDFAKFHPGGTLGKQLYLKVGDISINNQKPQVSPNAKIKEILFEMSSKRLGATAVVENSIIYGVITDGDIRRMLEKYEVSNNLFASDIMNSFPKKIQSKELAIEALSLMKQHNINQLMVLDNDEYAGFIHIQDLIREGIV